MAISLCCGLPSADCGAKSEIRNPQSKNGGRPVESDGLRHRRSPESWDAGCLHVHEEGAAAAAGVELTLTLLGVLPGFFAILAADGEGQRPQALLADLLAALEAVPVGALLEAPEGVVDLVQRLGLHLDERELQIFLDVGLSALDRIEDLVELAAPRALLADAPHLHLHFCVVFTAAFAEHLLQFGIARPGHPRCRFRLGGVLHDRRSFRPGPAGCAALKMAENPANELPMLD